MLSTRSFKMGMGLGLVLMLSGLLHAQAGYMDTFEMSTLFSYWTVTQQFGTVSLSTAVGSKPYRR